MDLTQWAAAWDVPEADAESIRRRLCHHLHLAFNPSSSVLRHGLIPVSPNRMGSPGAVGLYLLTQMGTDLTPLPEELRLHIANTTCQHRIQLFSAVRRRSALKNSELLDDRAETVDQVPAIHYYDGRAMYLGCCGYAAVAGGRYRYVEGEDIFPEERGRARVRFEAEGWQHVGLLAVKQTDGEGWDWPLSGETWADLCEIRYARKQGWEVEVLEKITWPESRPLGVWADRLARLYLHATERDPLMARCYRSIVLHTIGRLHNVGWREERSIVPADDPRATFEVTEAIIDGQAHIRERVQFGKRPEHSHPEWSAAIWSVCHLRVAQALLAVPPESIVAVRGDAIYLTQPAPADDPAWRDGGRCGQLREKWRRSGPLPYPRSWSDLRSVVDA